MRSVEDTAAAFDRACRVAGVNYAVVGGFAVSAWGQPRTTSDIDALVLIPNDAAVPAFVVALRAEGLSCSSRDLDDARRSGGHVTAFDDATHFHVDLKLARSAHEQAQVDDALELPFHGVQLRVVRPEETIAYKLKFGSEQDVKDARSILVRQATRLDDARLEAFAARLGVLDALARLRREIEAAR